MARALTLPADGLILDLEDAVPPDRKATARSVVRRWLDTLDFGGRERWVRVNPVAGGLGAEDVEATIAARPDGYVVPKVSTAAEVRAVAQLLDRLEYRHGLPAGSTRLMLIATETPEGLLRVRELARASPRVVAMSWGVEDLGAAMGLERVRDERGAYLDLPRYARIMCAVAAAAAGVEAIDTVFTDLHDLDGLRRECREAVAMGFVGKLSIHPQQVPVINEAFTPAPEVVAEARELVAAFVEHRRRGVYAFTFRGRMVDAPHLARALKILARAGEPAPSDV